jgi:alpha-mannosidase
MGYACYRLVPKQAASRPVENLSPRANVLENALLRADIQGDGTVRLLDKQTGRLYEHLNYFEDEGECGGPLVHYKANGDATYTTLGNSANIALVSNGPLVSTYRIEREWSLPEGLVEERKIHVPHGSEWVDHGAMRRSSRKSILKVVTEVTLCRDSGWLDFVTTVENTITDHRLRVCFPSGMAKATTVHVDSPFDVVSRPIAIPDSTGWYEAAARTLPTTSFVDVSDGDAGLAVLHYGFSEYEVIDDPTRTVALTMLRCFGTAGNPTETHVDQPLAQCQGRHTFRYAVQPHVGDWRTGGVLGQAGVYTSRLRAVVCTAHAGTLPRCHSFFSLEPKTFVVTAVKQSEAGDGIVVRGYNPTSEVMKVTLKLPDKVVRATQVMLEETAVGELSVCDGKVSVSARAGEIVSILVRIL